MIIDPTAVAAANRLNPEAWYFTECEACGTSIYIQRKNPKKCGACRHQDGGSDGEE